MDQPSVSSKGEKQSSDSSRPRFIVGIGASAGGLEALERLFQKMPSDTGMAFVVVQHLSPDFESVMDELLIRQTDIPVHMVADGMSVQSNAIYLIPPKKEMIISDGRLLLTDKDLEQGLTLPIDQFFRSLAQDVGANSIGVILSGTGSDGSRGVRDIHEAGGLVIVQSEDTAKFDGMPKSAMETGIVDVVLAPEDVADALQKYAQHPVASELAQSSVLPAVDEGDLNKLMRLLRDAYGIDFSLYKPSTVARRIERRILLSHTSDFEQYVEQVCANPDELNSLYRDLLIGVTQFFRDREAFAILETRVLPELLSKRESQDEVRIWIAGCATGEEAYSMAILLHEAMALRKEPLSVKIFATDVHQASLDVASAGVYAEESLTDVSQERREKYFTRNGDEYHVSADLRQMIVFAKHNIIKDAPFTKLDLISCRNLLIYLQPNVQKKAVSLFHFGLKTTGFMFLGPSEGIGDFEDEFSTLDRHWKIYRKRRDVRLATDLRLPMAGLSPSLRITRPAHKSNFDSDSDLRNAYDQLLDQFVPHGVLVNDRREIVHVFGNAGRFLRIQRGRTSTDLLDLCDADLKAAISGAIQRVSKELKPIAYSGLTISTDRGPEQVHLCLKPIIAAASQLSHILVTFEDMEPAAVETKPIDIGEVSRERITSLEVELRHTRENLQATVEELETSNEELQATNEELVASNEELQSTNEELHSVNEELYTVNAEYQRKITELTELTDDMENLLSSTDIGVLFLDNELRIRKFTPRIAKSFNILQQDVGRPFSSFTNSIQYSDLLNDVKRVSKSGQRIEKKVCDRFNHWYLLRILPYSSKSGVDGVVVTLIDIQSLKDAEFELEEKDHQLQGILDNSPAFMFVKDLDGRYILGNRRSKRFLNAPADDVIGKTDFDLLPRDVADRMDAQDRTVLTEGKPSELEQVVRRSGKARVFLSVKFPLRNDDGRITSLAGFVADITKQKRSETRAKKAVKYRDQFLAMLSHELRNPLAAVQNASEYLSRIPTNDTDIRKVADMVDRQVGQMARLIDDLLDISRITRRKLEVKKEVVDIRDVAKEAELAVRSLATARQVSLNVTLPDDPLFIYGDASRLQQVLVNLLVNAAKYTPVGGTIECQVERSSADVIIKVKDDGVGMSPELQKKVFEPFVQADETLDRSDGGMGVGLTLVRSLVELHDGTVSAHSAGRGQGSEFTIRMPLTRQAPNSTIDDAQPISSPENSFDRSRVLIVEDNPDVREMMQMLLELDGHDVSSVGDGISALTSVESNRPDIGFIDIGIPELNGYEVAKRVREKHNSDEICLVALTGYGQPSDLQKSREAGFDEHITKPVNMQRIHELLREVSAGGNRLSTSKVGEATK